MTTPVPIPNLLPICKEPFGFVIAPPTWALSFRYILNIPTPFYSSINLAFSTPSIDIIPFPIPGFTGGYYKIEENKAFDPNGILSIGGKGITTNIPQPIKFKKIRKRLGKTGIKYWIWKAYIPRDVVKIFPFQIVKTNEKLINNPINIPSFNFNFNTIMSVTNITTQIDFYFDGLISELVRSMINAFGISPTFIDPTMTVGEIIQKVLTKVDISRLLYAFTGGSAELLATPIELHIELSNIKFQFSFTFVNFEFQFGNAKLQFSDLGFTTGPIDVLGLLRPTTGIDISALRFTIGVNNMGKFNPLSINIFLI